MDRTAMPEIVDGLPNICGADAQVEEVTRDRGPVFLPETNLRLDKLQAVFAVALHMQQPLIPAGGRDLRTADIISNLDYMMRNPGSGDNHNASGLRRLLRPHGRHHPGAGPRGPQPARHARLLRRAALRPAQDGSRRRARPAARHHLRPAPAQVRRMARHHVGPCRGLVHALAGPEAAHAGLAAQLRGRLRLGRPRPGTRLLAAGDAPAQPSRRRLRVRQGAEGVRLQVAAGAGTHRRNAGGPRPRLQAPAAPAVGPQLRRRRGVDHRRHQDAGLGHQAGGADAAVLRGQGPAARATWAASAFRRWSRRSATARTAA